MAVNSSLMQPDTKTTIPSVVKYGVKISSNPSANGNIVKVILEKAIYMEWSEKRMDNVSNNS